ncbi:Hypothetical predicted protein [Paramuricea clavata]|uniref:Uncharacterized protein n=1 Tax=Paramuricea clavata TaxID=317549 RepID=A0A6S7I7N4_PARCT|nr:Hypothetical predicted protein [Paramuricea clavata]
MENTNVSSSDTGKRGLFVWREHHEMGLLREVLTHEPYRFRFGSVWTGAVWTAIACQLEDMGMKVNQRSVREKFTGMMTSFKKKEAQEKRASGVDVDFTEKDQVLLDIMERMEECEEENEQERQKENYDKETGAETRKRAVERLGETRGNDPMWKEKKEEHRKGNGKEVESWWKY